MTDHKNKDEQSNGLFDFGESLLNVAESALKGKDVVKAISEELLSDSSAIIESATEIGQGIETAVSVASDVVSAAETAVDVAENISTAVEVAGTVVDVSSSLLI